jgi:F-type H+-transporting ATPase subunit b
MLVFLTSLAGACETWRKRPAAAVCSMGVVIVVCLGTLLATGSGVAWARTGQAAPAPAQAEPAATPVAAPGTHTTPATPPAEAAPGGEGAGESHDGGEHSSPWGFIGKIVNFAILVGALVYFLRAPIATYLGDRSVQIRSDLTTAARMTQEAKAQVAALDAKLQQLPGEIAALRARGQDEVAAEEARIRADAQADRDRILEETKREIDLQLRLAHRELVTHAADLAVQIARGRISERITNDDQLRLVDRYLQQVKKA